MDVDSFFDVVVLGTGLTESISAAALAKAGLSVLQVDTNGYYGGNEACLTTKEILAWIESTRNSTSSLEFHGCSGNDLGASSSRSYALSLAPSIIPATGPLISSLVGSGVSRYGEFKLMQKLSIFLEGKFRHVPGNKEDIFKSKDLSLIDKRKLMRFLTFALGDFENASELKGEESASFVQFLKNKFQLSDALVKTIAFALALNNLDTDQTLDTLKRLRHFLRSSGRYGPSPFLVGLFGGLGELSQGFCRACAVSGGTYMLNQEIESISSCIPSNSRSTEGSFRLALRGTTETATCRLIVSSGDFMRYLPNANVETATAGKDQEITAYGIVVIKSSISVRSFSDPPTDEERSSDEPEKMIDAALLVFPPCELPSGKAPGAVTVLINGEGASSCPRGESILYFTSRLPPEHPIGNEDERNPSEHLLTPYLEATLSSIIPWRGREPKPEDPVPPTVVFKAFYIRKASPGISPFTPNHLPAMNVVVSSPLTSHIATNGDDATSKAEAVFREALNKLGMENTDGPLPLWPPLENDADEDDD